MGGYGSQKHDGTISIYPTTISILKDDYDDVTGEFTDSDTSGPGVILGGYKIHSGNSVETGAGTPPSTEPHCAVNAGIK